MDELDGDTIRVTDQQGRRASRDIVQFVPFRNFMNLSGITYQTSRLYLAKEVLAEIPGQFLGFMKTRNITPQKLAKKLTNQPNNLPPDPELLTQSGF